MASFAAARKTKSSRLHRPCGQCRTAAAAGTRRCGSCQGFAAGAAGIGIVPICGVDAIGVFAGPAVAGGAVAAKGDACPRSNGRFSCNPRAATGAAASRSGKV
jgi:hypothetical protein